MVRAAAFVGRVGGLAVALGIGAAVYGGVAWADDAAPARDPSSSSSPASSSSPSRSSSPARNAGPRARGAAAVRSAARPAAANRVAASRVSVRAAAPAAIAAPVARAASEVTLESPVALTSAPVDPAPVTTTVTGSDRIVVDPTMRWNEGVFTGTLNATSPEGRGLSYVMVAAPSGGGKLGSGPLLPLTNFRPGGEFTYVPDVSSLTDPQQPERFRVMALATTPITAFIEDSLGPLGELLVPRVLAVIHQIPLIGALLTPIIGAATVVTFEVDSYRLAAGRPTAFTYRMPSFDGTPISLNYFPALNVANGEVSDAPTVFAASGLACAANTDPTTVYGQLFPAQQFGSFTPGIAPLRSDSFTSTLPDGPSYSGGGGYNVVTWDPRGEFASGGQLNIDNPFLEGRDVSAMITWLTSAANPARAQIRTLAGDPLVGMTGGSYGGGIQLTTVDPRIDSISPEIAWNSLIGSLYPNNNQFKTGWGGILALALAATGARVNPAIYQGILTGVLFGSLSPSSQAVLASVGPTVLLKKEQAPTLLFQGIQDGLFPLAQSAVNAQTIAENPLDTPVKMVWFCGGHGTCLDPVNPFQDPRGLVDNLKWLDQYVAKDPDNPADAIPVFQWYDQHGEYHSAPLLPFEDGFNTAQPYRVSGPGGFLGLVPLIGGSGPYPLGDLPFSITNAGPARNAVSLGAVPAVGSQIVGTPTVSFSYRGLGTSRTVYAQLVDNATGRVLGNQVTPIPVTLDGSERTVTWNMEDIVYTAGAGDSLTLQITSSAVNYANFIDVGVIDISELELTLPIRAS